MVVPSHPPQLRHYLPMQYLRNSDKNEYIKNKLSLKKFHQGIALRDISSQNFFFNLFSTVLMWPFRDKFLSNITRKSSMDDVLSIILYPIFNDVF